MRLQPRVVACAIACFLALPGGALAATFTVNSTTDAPDLTGTDSVCLASGSVCTLRAAVQQANASGGNDTIILPAGVYQLTVSGANEDLAAQGDLDLGVAAANAPESIDIVGAGARATRISQATGDRVFHLVGNMTTANISGVTVTGGGSVSSGGGILNATGTLNISDVAITANTAGSSGGGLANNATANLTRVTISGNVVSGAGGTPQGGGLAAPAQVGSTSLSNVTISGNSAINGDGFAQGGGVSFASASGSLTNVTIVGNTVSPDGSIGGGIHVGSDLTFRNTIVALNRVDPTGSASNCFDAGAPFAHSAGHNLEEGTDCNFTAAGDKRGVDPLLGPLQDNGGQTDTRALLAGSPALDAGDNAGCPSTDQRGVARPQNGICDIGAFELVPAVLPPVLPPSLPDPVLGRTVNVGPVSGRVFYAVPARSSSIAGVRASQKGLKFKLLKQPRQLPVRSFLNTRRGTVRLTSARAKKGATQTGTFASGLFQILQSRKKQAKGLTELRLKGSSFKRCTPRKRGKRAQAALSKKAIRRLRSNARGRFRTRGRYSAATVRGTKWLTSDRCDGTLTKVTRGKVAVRDFRRKKTIIVKRGKRYLAKAPVR